MTWICPSCGLNIERERLIEDGPFRYDPRKVSFEIADEPLPCPPQMREMLGSIMLARGRTLTYDAIAARMGYEGDAPRKLIYTLASRARRLFEARGHRPPFTMVHGVGMRWVPLQPLPQ